MFNFFIFLFCLLILISTSIILFTLFGKKPFKSKADILFIEKQCLKFLIMLLYLALFIYNLFKSEENENAYDKNDEIICKIKIIIFNVYAFLLFSNNFCLCLEDYLTYINPCHYFNSLFIKSKYFLYEGITACAAILLSFIYYNPESKLFILFIPDKYNSNSNNTNFNNNLNINNTFNNINSYSIYANDNISNNSNNFNISLNNIYLELNDQSPFIIVNLLKIIIIFLMNIVMLILYLILLLRLKKIIFKAREKLFRIIKGKILSTILYIIFISFNLIVFLNDPKTVPLHIINSILFLIAYLIDSFLEFMVYSTSKFAQYKLKHTIVHSLGSLLNRDKEEEHPTNAFLDSMLEESSYLDNNSKKYGAGNKANNVSNDDIDDEDDSLIMPLTNSDVELVLIYRNKLFIEDYFYYYYDYIMNLTLCSLFKVYKDKKFSPSILKDNNLNKELNISESAIFGEKNGNTNVSSSTLKRVDASEEDNSTCINNLNYDEFEMIRNSERNDFFYCDEIFSSNSTDFKYDDLKVKISSYFTSNCVSNLLDKNFTSKSISDSLNSHLKDENIETDKKVNRSSISTALNSHLPYHSILSANAKEEFFLNIKNMTIKSYDKQLIFDIFETNDDEINVNIGNSNKKIAKMLDEYFDYIKGVGVLGTFLPILIGIFKVKINSFKTMLIYVSCNSLVENSPSNSFSYWQLIRFSLSNPKKLSSSKYRHSVLIGDDLIFDRKYALPSIKEDNDSTYNTIELKNFLNFEEIIKHDITFLHKCGVKNSDLLIMYFEYENVQKHEAGGAIKILKTEDNKAEIVNTTVTMPILRDDDESDENLYIVDLSKSKQKDLDNKLKEEALNLVSDSIDNDSKANEADNEVVNNRYSDINQTLNIDKNLNRNNNGDNKNNGEKEEDDNIEKNLDISKSIKSKENDLLKSNTFNSVAQSMYGSLINNGFLDDASLDNPSSSNKIPNIQDVDHHNMLNYSETIKINSYDGYFDAFNCMCLFSFENIFDLNSSCPCSSFNFNKLQTNILKNFSNYTPRKHTTIKKKNSKEN